MVYKNPDASIEERVDDLLARMTLEEKFWQLFMIPGDITEEKEKFRHGIFGFQVATKSSTGNEVEQILEYSTGGNAKETAFSRYSKQWCRNAPLIKDRSFFNVVERKPFICIKQKERPIIRVTSRM